MENHSQRGSADVALKDGTVKSPDASFYNMTPPRDENETIAAMASIQSNPTMVWEITFSETAKKLAKDCGRWVAASGGMINIAVGICIDCGTADQDRVLKKISLRLGGIKLHHLRKPNRRRTGERQL